VGPAAVSLDGLAQSSLDRGVMFVDCEPVMALA